MDDMINDIVENMDQDKPICTTVINQNVSNQESSPPQKNDNISSNILSSIQDGILSEVCYKELIRSIHTENYRGPFYKLGNISVPDCQNPIHCLEKHKDVTPESTDSDKNKILYIMLSAPIDYWDFDFSDIYLVLQPDKYLSSDILRILFDYILHGPEKEITCSAVKIIASNLELHPPCLVKLKKYYKQLLFEYDDNCYFKTQISKVGVFMFVIRNLEDMVTPPISNAQEREPVAASSETITFELLEDRWNRFESLVEKEYDVALDLIEDVAESENDFILSTEALFKRMIIALESVINILEHDFLICVGKLKSTLTNMTYSQESCMPLIKTIVYTYFEVVLKIFGKTQEKQLWIQLLRLIAVMIESEHLFYDLPIEIWQYPNVNERCLKYADAITNVFISSEWDSNEKLLRLQHVSPPWLQLRVAMACVNAKTKVNVGLDLKAIVEIIHMHIKRPLKLEIDSKKTVKVKSELDLSHLEKLNCPRNAYKKNAYGETLLHKLCKRNGSVAELEYVLKQLCYDVDVKDNFGWTPLHTAVHSNSILKVKLLLQYKQSAEGNGGVNIAAQNQVGTTSLHVAVSNDNLQMCDLLLQHGGVSLLRIADYKGITPLDLSKEKPEIQRFFETKIHMQEQLNLQPDSELNLPDHLITLLRLAYSAFIEDHNTKKIYDILKNGVPFEKVTPSKYIVLDYTTLVKYKNDQDQYRKLRKIINSLAENSHNSPLLKEWHLDLNRITREFTEPIYV